MTYGHNPRIIESQRLIGNPTRAACLCGWRGTTFSFATKELRQEHAAHEADVHHRCMTIEEPNR